MQCSSQKSTPRQLTLAQDTLGESYLYTPVDSRFITIFLVRNNPWRQLVNIIWKWSVFQCHFNDIFDDSMWRLKFEGILRFLEIEYFVLVFQRFSLNANKLAAIMSLATISFALMASNVRCILHFVIYHISIHSIERYKIKRCVEMKFGLVTLTN